MSLVHGQHSIRLNPSFSKGYSRIGTAYANLGKCDQPGNPPNPCSTCECWELLRRELSCLPPRMLRRREAIFAFGSCLKLDPENATARQVLSSPKQAAPAS